jgi:glutamate-5-semialdehyde dehydrogenase
MTLDPLNASQLSSAVVQQAYRASLELAKLKGLDRSRAVQAMAQALKGAQNEILEANTLDLEASRDMAIPELVLEWLKLTPERLQATVQLLERLGELPDPIDRVMPTSHQVVDCQTYGQLMPLGVIALIYEAFPELGSIAAGLCLKTGNSLILRGSSEASHSNAVIAQVLQAAIADWVPIGALELLPADQGNAIRDLVTQDQWINLVIPYGRPKLVQQVMRQATAPALKTAIGNCYLYWSPLGSLEAARWIITDSHQGQPDAVNAIEKVLIDQRHNRSSLVMLWNSLREKGFEIRGDETLVIEFPDLLLAEQMEWNQPYLDKIVAFKIVDNLEAAIAWINQYSSGHADCLVTESYSESRQLAQRLQSASIYINASPRFYRHPKRGEAVFLGMSNQRGLRRGLIGLEALTTTKQVIQGSGQF